MEIIQLIKVTYSGIRKDEENQFGINTSRTVMTKFTQSHGIYWIINKENIGFSLKLIY